MKLILVDINAPMCDAWREYFNGLPDVEIVHDSFETLDEFDCIVSPANSFGLMDGGLDLIISNFFGEQLAQHVQERVISDYFGEQPVGTSIIVETGDDKHPFLAHTPTMRVPMNISRTDNPYIAMWAMLRAVHHHNATQERKIASVACSGLGTGYGEVPFAQAGRQMALAYTNYLNPPESISWGYAKVRHYAVRDTFIKR
ncbi:MAG: macro domain-containing protein [Aggregatilineales bacterium]